MAAMNVPADLDLTISQGANGKYSYQFGQGAYTDGHGNLDFSKVPDHVLIRLNVKSTTLNVSFVQLKDNPVLIAETASLKPGECPTTPPSSGPDAVFNTIGFIANDPTQLQIVDNNDDGKKWNYALRVVSTKSDGSTETILVDPGIINH